MPCQVLPVVYSGGFTAGAEARIYHHFSISAEAGRFYDPGYIGKVNFKCYIPDADSEVKYVAVELAYKRQSYTVEDNIKGNSGSYPEPGAPVDYSVAKTVKILNLKYGQLALSRHAFM